MEIGVTNAIKHHLLHHRSILRIFNNLPCGGRGKGTKQMKFSNRTYDILKELTTVWLPALGTLYFALSGIWGFPYGEQIVGTITAVVTFLGVCLHLSTNNYRSDKIQDTFNTDDIDMIEVEHEDQNEPTEE